MSKSTTIQDFAYLDLIDFVRDGVAKSDRTGVGTISNFGFTMRFRLEDGFPLLTLKKTHWKSVVLELLWMLSGDTNVRWLQENGVTIWNEWADENGDLGPVYGAQWRHWRLGDGTFFDQLYSLVEEIKTNPDSRRHIISAWNVGEIREMALPPCHAFMQFYVADGELSCMLTQRSADVFLGVPFNIASYALLTHILARICGYKVGTFVHSIGDAHIYTNHLPQVFEMIEREPLQSPTLELSNRVTKDAILNDPKSLGLDDFKIVGYECHPAIKAEVAV